MGRVEMPIVLSLSRAALFPRPKAVPAGNMLRVCWAGAAPAAVCLDLLGLHAWSPTIHAPPSKEEQQPPKAGLTTH